jgi:hypothetical protein
MAKGRFHMPAPSQAVGLCFLTKLASGISDRWRLNTAFADCRKATYTAKEGGTTSAAWVQKHLPWKDAAIVRRSQCMLALRPDA